MEDIANSENMSIDKSLNDSYSGSETELSIQPRLSNSSGHPHQIYEITFNNPFFEDFTRILNPGYDLPKHNALATSILDSEAASVLIKVDKELSKAKNLTLCIDSWCSSLKHSIYAFVIVTNEKKQYIYSLRDFSKSSHTADFNSKKIMEVLESVGPEKFIAIVSDAESSMIVAK
ncbi:29860_t:CDS:2 [Racocetra persica]|uniref:29860_t:CDS:1 n=1 Tax=Racocetra persica TaxID=160502 RepID=A0ACA9P6C3_9GLOM|nr:29860_t:CDS:2 [Racocetra persica]